MQSSSTATIQSLRYAVTSIVLAAALGLVAGALMGWLTPSDKFSWVGLVLLPLWFMLELFFESVVAVLGSRAQAVRIASGVAVLAGFYFAWFAWRGFSP